MRRTPASRRFVNMAFGVLLTTLLAGLAACSGASSSSSQQTPSTTPGTAGIGTPTPVPSGGSFNVSFQTQYALNTCDVSEPVDTLCLDTSGVGDGSNNGAALKSVGLQQSSAYEPGDGSTCTPAKMSGKLLLTIHDTATFTGIGTFCRATQVATFTYTITGGTGTYANASGTGTVHIPSPSSQTDSTETWTGSLTA